MQESWEAYEKTGGTSCTKRTISFVVSGFHTETRLLQRDFIFWTYLDSILFLCSKCTIQSHIINFQPFLTSFVIFHAFTDYFELWDHEIEKYLKSTLKRLKVGMVPSFHPHSMCKKVERVTAKTECTSCTKRTISFEVLGFHTETHLLQRDFNFWTYLNSRLFVCSKCTIQSHIINFQPFLTSFVIFIVLTNFLS